MFTVSIYINEKEMTAAVYGEDFTQTASKSASLSDVSLETTVNTAALLCADILEAGGIDAQSIRYVAVTSSAHPEALADIAAELEGRIKIKCVGVEPTHARALGEAFLSGDEEFLVMLKIDDTVKSGVVINKSIIPSDLGQIVIDHGGYGHTNGRKGSFESYACREGFARICSEAGVENAESITLSELFSKSDAVSNAAKTRYVEYLAAALTNVINLFQPNELVLDAFFEDAGEALMTPVMDIVLREQYSRTMKNKCNVRFARDEKITALLGATLIER